MNPTRNAAPEEQWRLLRELCGDVVELRRGDHSARRLELERARLAMTWQHPQTGKLP